MHPILACGMHFDVRLTSSTGCRSDSQGQRSAAVAAAKRAGDGGSGRSHAIDEEARHDAGSDQPVVTLMTELLTQRVSLFGPSGSAGAARQPRARRRRARSVERSRAERLAVSRRPPALQCSTLQGRRLIDAPGPRVSETPLRACCVARGRARGPATSACRVFGGAGRVSRPVRCARSTRPGTHARSL